MAKIIPFPSKKAAPDSTEARKKLLEQRLGELEARLNSYQQDMEYLTECCAEDANEMGLVITELTGLYGFNENNSGLADTLQQWLDKDKGTDEDR